MQRTANMADVVSKAVRSRMMASIRARDTKPELQVRRYLHSRGFRFRLVRKDLPGKPDIVLPKWQTVVFVHGCFWHGHVCCRYSTMPKTRTEFWSAKIVANAARDAQAVDSLMNLGWRVVIVWECALRDAPDVTLVRIEEAIRSSVAVTEIRGPSQQFK